jgi:uncharacterized protein YijF (DUF1287 family)
VSKNKRKGRKRKARKSRILLLLLSVVIILAAVFLALYELNIIPHPYYTNEDFGIADYISENDQDGDGIDDQTDMLQGVRDYIATKPKYKSVYYNSGYPDDEYGVCTDVVAQGMLAAGYDLMALVNRDIVNNPSEYNIEKPDINIDFRRVRNLNVYFRRHAVSLTTDINEIEEWQGGDIIVFKKHIGIISDRRNADGIPLMIHHSNPSQVHYEQDKLADRDDIIGHYRIS